MDTKNRIERFLVEALDVFVFASKAVFRTVFFIVLMGMFGPFITILIIYVMTRDQDDKQSNANYRVTTLAITSTRNGGGK